MKIKSFKIFENESTTKSKSFGPNQHKEFCEEVAKWASENKQDVRWCLFAFPKPETEEKGFNRVYGPNRAKIFWDMYVKGNKQMTIIEMGDSLVSVIHDGDNIELAYDNMDFPVDKSKVKDLI